MKTKCIFLNYIFHPNLPNSALCLPNWARPPAFFTGFPAPSASKNLGKRSYRKDRRCSQSQVAGFVISQVVPFLVMTRHFGDVVERTGRKCEGQWSDRALLDGVVNRGVPLRLRY